MMDARNYRGLGFKVQGLGEDSFEFISTIAILSTFEVTFSHARYIIVLRKGELHIGWEGVAFPGTRHQM